MNAVAAKERYGAPCIVVDFGTSTNFDVVSAEGEYVGGVLAPGIEISMDALFARAARLMSVDFIEPPSVIGKTTVHSLQSGLVYGFAGQVDGIVEGSAASWAPRRGRRDGRAGRADRPARPDDRAVDPDLTLEGLRLIWALNAVIALAESVPGSSQGRANRAPVSGEGLHTGEETPGRARKGRRPRRTWEDR